MVRRLKSAFLQTMALRADRLSAKSNYEVHFIGLSVFDWNSEVRAVANFDASTNRPLNQAQLDQLTLANQRAKTVRNAARVAAFNGWMFGIFAALSAPFAVFSLSGMFVTAGLAFVAVREFQGRHRLLKFDPKAATLLGWNQIGLVIVIVVYCGWMIIDGLTSPNPIAAQLKGNPELESALGSLDGYQQLYSLVLVAVYGTVAVVSGIAQGLNAVYYFTRRKHLEAYVRETPPWILDLQRTMDTA